MKNEMILEVICLDCLTLRLESLFVCFFPIGSFKNSERTMELTLVLSVADDTFVY